MPYTDGEMDGWQAMMQPTDPGATPSEAPTPPSATPSSPRGKRDAGQISAIMRQVRGRDTTPEMQLRRALWASGLRYAVTPPDLPGKPDIVFTRARLAVFVDGDYWHGNQWRRRGKAALEEQFAASSDQARAYWLRKIRRNMARDAAHTTALLASGWTVLRLWESEISADLEGCVARVTQALSAATAPATSSVPTSVEGEPAGQPAPDVETLRARLPERSCAEFFAGIGLMRLGLERTGWRVTFANDIDERKHAMYTTHFGPSAGEFILGDVHTLPVERIPSVTLATASFPCNDLSLAGARLGLAGKQSGAFWGFIRALTDLGERRPPLALLENVPGFLTSHHGADFLRALQALNDLGYTVDVFQLDAAHFTPQSRRRLFVVAAQSALLPPEASDVDPAEQAAQSPVAVRPPALVAAIARAAGEGVRWRIRPLPAPPARPHNLEEALDDLPDDAPEWWSHERAAYLLSQMSPRHRALADEMIAGDAWRYGTVFRRMRRGRSMAELRADGIAGCLRTPRGGSGRQIIFKAGHGRYQVRLLTPREAARLMGAPDFRISGSLNDALFGFGDAVCADAITWIARYYLDPLVNELLRGVPLRPPVAAATMRGADHEP